MLNAYKPGWVVIHVQVNPPDSTGDFSALAAQGLGVLVCLNNGYGRAGSIPSSAEYEEFARQCADFVGDSSGARVWIIGNAPNRAAERPGNDGSANSGEVITPEMYARCFNECRQAIRAVPGHESDFVIPAAIAPFNSQTHYLNNPNGDWVRYFADVLFQITTQGGKVDGLALHVGTHGHEANLITSEARGHGHFSVRRWQFRAYRDFLAAVLPAMRNLPVFITQAHPFESGWTNHNRKWVQAASIEINAWNENTANQPIQALCFYRWHQLPVDSSECGMSDKPQVIEDFCAALQNDYRVHWHGVPLAPDYAAQWLKVIHIPDHMMRTKETVSGQLVVKNTGAKVWLGNGPESVQLACFWYDAQGHEAIVQHFDLTQNVLPGQTLRVDDIQVQAPKLGGTYVCRFDLTQSDKVPGTPAKDLTIYVEAPPYAVEWDEVIAPDNGTMPPDSERVGTVRVLNLGSRTWLKSGPNPVRLGYQWYNARGILVAGREDFEMGADTPPGETATFEPVILRAPSSQGTFTLRWDLYELGLTTFSVQEVKPREQQVVVKQEFATRWLNVFEIPTALEPNETFTGSLTMQNIGTQVWDETVHLAYEWRDTTGGQMASGQFALGQVVLPDSQATFDQVTLHAPVPQGQYTLVFQFVKAGAKWDSRPYELPVTVHTDAPAYAAEWIRTPSIPKHRMITGDSLRGQVVLKNTGALTWESSTCLRYRWYDAEGREIILSVPGISLVHDILPRETETIIEATLLAPDTPGEYKLQWDLYQGTRWLNIPSEEFSITVKLPPLAWGAEFVAHDMPPRLVAGETTNVHVRLKNIGKNTWRSGGARRVTLGYKWLNASGPIDPEAGEIPSALPTDVPPEDLFTDSQACFTELDMRIAAPERPDIYRLQIDLFAEGVGWFSEGHNPALDLGINVTETPAPTNLWRAEASHNASAAILALDGKLDSAWAGQSDQMPGMWFRVSLGEPRLIDGIAFRSPGRGYPCGYVLRVSPDGRNWHTLASAASENRQDIVAIFAPCQVLYAQVDLVAPREEVWEIAEVQIHPCRPWNATASLNNELAHAAIDNDPATAWTTAPDLQTPNQWFQLDLGRVETLSEIHVSPLKDEMPHGYRVTVWNEAAGGWQKIAERHNDRAAIHLSFAPVQTQYINLQLLDAAAQPWTIREIALVRAICDWIGPTTH